MHTRIRPNETPVTYYRVKLPGGAVVKVTEPIARMHVKNGAEALDDLPVQTRASKAGTKTIDAGKVSSKAG